MREGEQTNYKLTITEGQLKILHNAIEEYFRLRMGQFWDLSNELTCIGFDYEHHTKDEFNRRIKAREEFREWNEQWFRNTVRYPVLLTSLKTEAVNNGIDMWHVIEHQQWLDNPNRGSYDRASCKPFQMGTEPMMQIERVEDEQQVKPPSAQS